jgi:hypothetical protein
MKTAVNDDNSQRHRQPTAKAAKERLDVDGVDISCV